MKRTLVAFAVAPLVPPILYWAFHSAPNLTALGGILLYGSMVGYLATAIIGVPAYCLLRAHSRLRLRHVLLISATVGAVTLSLMSHGRVEAQTIGIGALYGLSAGICFWLLWWRNAAQQGAAGGPGPRLRSEPGR